VAQRCPMLVFGLILSFAALACAADKPAKKPPEPVKPEEPGNLQADFAAFLKSPGRETFLRAQKSLAASPAYAPRSPEFEEVEKLLQDKDYAQAKEVLDAAMPNLLLSPRAHSYAADVAKGLGDGPAAKKEADIAAKLLEGLLSTGDGSQKLPIAVTRPSDEYDVARHLKKRISGQSPRSKDGQSFDVLQCPGDTELWFNTTAPMSKGFPKQKVKIKPPKLDQTPAGPRKGAA
jgi:hypothetical protein